MKIVRAGPGRSVRPDRRGRGGEVGAINRVSARTRMGLSRPLPPSSRSRPCARASGPVPRSPAPLAGHPRPRLPARAGTSLSPAHARASLSPARPREKRFSPPSFAGVVVLPRARAEEHPVPRLCGEWPFSPALRGSGRPRLVRGSQFAPVSHVRSSSLARAAPAVYRWRCGRREVEGAWWVRVALPRWCRVRCAAVPAARVVHGGADRPGAVSGTPCVTSSNACLNN